MENANDIRCFYGGVEKDRLYALEIIEKLSSAKNIKSELKTKLYTELASLLWIVDHKNNKLEGLKSLSTCCLVNPICRARMMDKESICSHCYAANQQDWQHGLADHHIVNTVILTSVIIPVKVFLHVFKYQICNERFFRIESFGDVSNVIQCKNYINLCRAFPKTSFAAWTKNDRIWQKAFAESGKPRNLVYIVSSDHVNEAAANIPENADHVFTVFDKNADVNITCGGKKCMECILAGRRCYFRCKRGSEDFMVNERLK